MKINAIKNELDLILNSIQSNDFVANDPISIPKRFSKLQDIEISAFFASILAWGQRKTIINNTNKLMHWMGEEPYRFVMEHSEKDLKVFESFVHRTFNSTDCLYFIEVLKQFYLKEDSLEIYFKGDTVKNRLIHFHHQFFDFDFAPQRTKKNIANPSKIS